MTIVSELVTSTVTRRVAYLHCDNHACHNKTELGAAERYENCAPVPEPELPIHWLKHAVAPGGYNRVTYTYYCSPQCAHAANKPVHVVKISMGETEISETALKNLQHTQELDVRIP